MQIDAGGEHPALPGQHHGLGVRAAQRLELRGDRLAEFDVERIGLAVDHRHDGDAAAVAQFDHVVPRGIEAPSGAAARRRRVPRRKPLGMDDGDRQHHDARDLVQQRQRQRRLVQQRHDADAGLQGDGAGERQRAVEHGAAAPARG